jgi:Rrf2 family protein
VLISSIAESERIPQKFLEAILLELKRNGYLNSKKGKGGGYYLIKAPDQINLAEIMRIFEGPIALLPCAANKYYEPCTQCKEEELCGMRSYLKDLRDETVTFLKGVSLTDVLTREKKLLKIR